MKSFAIAAALVAGTDAVPQFFWNGWNPFCAAQEVAAGFAFPKHDPVAASSYCTSVLSIAPQTSTATRTVTNALTTTVNVGGQTVTVTPTTNAAGATVTVTPTSTVAGSPSTVTPTVTAPATVSTCYFKATAAGQIAARTAAAEPWFWGWDNTQAIRDACQCDGVNLSPAAVTTSVTTTVSKVIATVTVTGKAVTATAPAVTVTGKAATATAPAVTVTSAGTTVTAQAVTVSTGTATSTIAPAATYTAPGGTKFLEFNGYDFYGNDLDAQYCGNNGQFKLPNNQTVPCTGARSCENACEAYNQATGSSKCVGTSYLTPNVFCYLKNTVNVCTVQPNSNVNSGAIIA